jgi:hypothetical protein
MSNWSDHLALTVREQEALRQAADAGDEALLVWLESIWREKGATPLRVFMRSWAMVHRCLTGDDLPNGGLDQYAGEYPLCLCFLGGEPLRDCTSQPTLWLIDPDGVAALASALHRSDETWLRRRFFSLVNQVFFDYTFADTWNDFRLLPPFFARAAGEGLAVVCTIYH